ncbi:DUF5317 domain-containing protein [Clostridium sp. SYSU_GA19001]|uniref:DUF5317 domain-containing protein n=1 Tax=Clostridium caldaquaticum TaxID=2940653 RepID=UPI0020776EA3|nr:DUF5317 domain-containing protein [Clostridium caldaquaticum]MCM8711500.1 DUF5317 domain-containing protein [Clostridium caldaquaticum]
MFIQALIIAVIIGYILKGSLKNIDASSIKGLYFVFTAFLIEFILIMLIRNQYLTRGIVTYVVNFIMYLLLFVFIYVNRRNKWIVLMGIGFLLNAIPIFLNGGAMPVSLSAVKAAGITQNVSSEGLYRLIDEGTKLAFLGDVIPVKYPRPFAVSIGDIVGAIGLMLFVITGMQRKKTEIKYVK